MKKKFLIVFCSVQHHEIPPYNLLALANRLSLQHPTIFIDLPTAENRSSFKSFLRLLVGMFFYLFKPKNILFWQPFFKLNLLNGLLLKFYLYFFKLISGYRVIFYTTSPKFDPVYHFIPADQKIADLYDNPDQVIQKNSRILAKYDKLLANSKQILNVLKKINKNCLLVSAAYHNYYYSLNNLAEKIPNSVVFFGGISHRINFNWLEEAVEKLPNVNFFFIGQKYLGKYYAEAKDEQCEKAWNKIIKNKNVHFWSGKIEQEMAQQVLASFSLGIIPYDIQDSFNLSSHPMKLYDYLASDLPVLTSTIPAILEYKNILPINFAKNSDEFIKNIKKLVSEPEPFSRATKRVIKKVLERHSLENKFLQIEKIIKE